MKNIINIIKRDDIGNPPWDYYFLLNLEEKEYPRYLSKLFYMNTGENLPLKYDFKQQAWVIDKKRCKTFNQKIQWIKLYGVTDLMRRCTDKVAVRDYVAEKIGSEYLKPVLQICDTFDEVDFDKLPNAFVMKCNHGCKWQYIIKDKENFLQNKQLFETVKRNITGWLEQEYWCWGGFEMQYKGIAPKILIEPLMKEGTDNIPKEIMIYFVNKKPTLTIKIHNKNEITLFNDKIEYIDEVLYSDDKTVYEKADKITKQSIDLCCNLAEDLNSQFLRIDWQIYKNNLYFQEITFTPYSGMRRNFNYKFNEQFGTMINLERG